MHLLFLDISGGEFLIILLVAFIVFGPKKLPEIARKMGRTMNEIKSVSGELTKEFTDQTRNIATELKNARETARLDLDLPDTNVSADNAESERIKALRQKRLANPKHDNNVNVSNDDNTNEKSVGYTKTHDESGVNGTVDNDMHHTNERN